MPPVLGRSPRSEFEAHWILISFQTTNTSRFPSSRAFVKGYQMPRKFVKRSRFRRSLQLCMAFATKIGARVFLSYCYKKIITLSILRCAIHIPWVITSSRSLTKRYFARNCDGRHMVDPMSNAVLEMTICRNPKYANRIFGANVLTKRKKSYVKCRSNLAAWGNMPNCFQSQLCR